MSRAVHTLAAKTVEKAKESGAESLRLSTGVIAASMEVGESAWCRPHPQVRNADEVGHDAVFGAQRSRGMAHPGEKLRQAQRRPLRLGVDGAASFQDGRQH